MARTRRRDLAKAAKAIRILGETKPWQGHPYGWKDRRTHAEVRIVQALKSNPERFEVRIDPQDPQCVLITTKAPKPRRITDRPHGWEKPRRRRPITIRVPVKVLRRMGINISRNGNGNGNGKSKSHSGK